MIIDTHQHFWKYDPVEYNWINDYMSVIRTDFLPENLKKEIDNAGIHGVISVQARQSVEETDCLLKLAGENDFIKGVTGWLPIADNNIESLIDYYSSDSYLKAVRHVLQEESDDYMLREDFNRGVSLLKKYNLIYEILIFGRQLKQAIKFVDHHPGQIFVLDHIAKPKIIKNNLSPWKENIKELAQRQNVYCKISGMVTEASYTKWTEDQLIPYLEVVLDAFGPDRLMFGSDWPVCLVACKYKKWLSIVKKFISRLSNVEQEKIMGINAVKIYKLEI